MGSNNCTSFSNRSGTVLNVVLVVAVLIFLAFLLAPVFLLRHPICGGPSNCEANLKQIGNAFKMHLSDWDETFPTNRIILNDGTFGPISQSVRLSDVGVDKNGKPLRFQYSRSWVECLYNYIEPVTAQDDYVSVWKCGTVKDLQNKPESPDARLTYVFNRNLVERKYAEFKVPAAPMLCRETDRLVRAELRPINKSVRNPNEPPNSPFLADTDYCYGKTDYKLHGKGSNILFADGHVKLLDAEIFFKPGCKWDPKEEAWYNKADPKNKEAYHAIRITP